MRQSMTLMVLASKGWTLCQVHVGYYNNCTWLLGVHCMPDPVGSALHVLSHQSSQLLYELCYYDPHFTDKWVEAQKGEVTCWRFLLFIPSVMSNFATAWTAACQASLSFTISRSLLKLMFIVSIMPSNHLILGYPLPSPAFNLSQPKVTQLINGGIGFRIQVRWPESFWLQARYW